ncbi:MAG: FtsQ-type POTRA domain-containing protein [Elusimicrobiota bacterium]|nr:FtsQ-type POTRA domain-containing protein [Elusimicrobiota bacterium]
MMKKRPRKKKKKGPGFKILFALFCLFALGTAAHFCYNFLRGWDKLNVTKIEIRGLSVLNEDYVKKLIDMKTGANIFSYKLQDDLFLKEQWIAKAKIRRVLPGKIIVKIKERIPAAMFMRESRKFIITLDDKIVRSVSAAEQKYQIPLWSDYNEAASVKRDEIMAFLKDIRDTENKFYEAIISFSMEGESLKMNMADCAVLFGSPERELVREKVESVGKVIKDAASKGRKIQYIDLRPFTKKMRSAIIKFHKGVENNK